MENNTVWGYQKHIKLGSKFEDEGYVVGADDYFLNKSGVMLLDQNDLN